MTRCIKVLYKNSLRPKKIALRKSLVNTIDTPCTSPEINA
nr:MAG TPA: hypothetical protein [Caudoviricetes sp.]DAY25891.1 MAG TPA: hypothetical protein [Caudoviricetes sp.]